MAQKLNLKSNRLGPDGAAALAPMLVSNATLQELNLWSNALGAEGAVHLARALGEGGGLQDLELGPPPPPPPRTNRTRRVLHPILIGHAASFTPY